MIFWAHFFTSIHQKKSEIKNDLKIDDLFEAAFFLMLTDFAPNISLNSTMWLNFLRFLKFWGGLTFAEMFANSITGNKNHFCRNSISGCLHEFCRVGGKGVPNY